MRVRCKPPTASGRAARTDAALSERALVEFTAWFLHVALDQVGFCVRTFDLRNLVARYRTLAHVATVMVLGEVERGLAGFILGLEEWTALEVLSNCVRCGWLKSDTPKGPVRVGFPVEDRAWLFPGLFTDEAVSERPRLLETPEPSRVRRRNAEG